jgi:glycogen synthase
MVNYLQCGYCFKNEDVTSLAQAIQQALLLYNQSAHLLAEANRIIRTELSGVQYVKQLQTLYTTLSAGGADRTLVSRS